MKNSVVISMLIGLIACTQVQDDALALQEKNNSFPNFAVKFLGFGVANEDSDAPHATAQDNANAKVLRVAEKKMFFDALDLARFIINTPEFAEEIQNHPSLVANENFSGPLGTLNKGDEYANRARLVQVIRDLSLTLKVFKRKMEDINTLAIGELPFYVKPDPSAGILGRPYNVYLDPQNPLAKGEYFIAFNNRAPWTDPNFNTNPNNPSAGYAFFSLLIAHELMHNLGFTHDPVININTDVAYVVGDIVFNLWADPLYRSKYEGVFMTFTPYYSVLDKRWLTADTLPVINSRLRNAFQIQGDGEPGLPEPDDNVIWSHYKKAAAHEHSADDGHDHSDMVYTIGNAQYKLICTIDEHGRFKTAIQKL